MRAVAVICIMVLIQAVLIAGGKPVEALPTRLYIVLAIIGLVGGWADVQEYWRRK